MTQRQRRDVAYLFACGSLVASLLFWTVLVTAHTQQNLQFPPSQSVWEGVLHTMGILTEDIVKTDTEVLHGAAFNTSASVLTVPSEVIGGTVPSDTSDANDNGPDELSQWEVHAAYSLSIPSLGVRTPILLPSMRFWENKQWNLLEEQMQVSLNYGSVAYPHSAIPGEPGNLIIAGHSSPPTERAAESPYGSLFQHVPELSPGDQIIVTKNGERLTYVVSNSVIVSPTQTDILRQQNDESIVKLITCYPVGTTRDRMVVTARLQK